MLFGLGLLLLVLVLVLGIGETAVVSGYDTRGKYRNASLRGVYCSQSGPPPNHSRLEFSRFGDFSSFLLSFFSSLFSFLVSRFAFLLWFGLVSYDLIFGFWSLLPSLLS